MNIIDTEREIARIAQPSTKAPVLVDVSEEDYAVTFEVGAISACSGTKILVTVNGVENVPIPAPCFVRISGITVVENANTDAGDIVLWPDTFNGRV